MMQSGSVLLCAVFITCFCYCDSSLDISVTQTPDELTVEEGQSVKISCCWNKIIPNIKVRWIKPNQTNKDLPTEILNNNCSVFSIRNACSNDTGLYICEVLQDIPVLVTVKGKGTTVRLLEKKTMQMSRNDPGRVTRKADTSAAEEVNPPAEKDSHKPPSSEKYKVHIPDDVLIYILRCLPFITLLLAVCYLNRDTSKKTRTKTNRENILNPKELEEEDEEPGEEPELNEEPGEEGEQREVAARRGEPEPEERGEEPEISDKSDKMIMIR
ncbi:uncharacterized protein LOC107197227 isoform X2 [Astyanax mexicanus]|uniref:uncharacterized protein LOC107197227 isoform X2 n=1 Tax=Astyanax mexicanus TaxID=7994 RepID=UPI0020CB2DF6|nr:uncharacterized protein LOC107197227 isoform X2 [Astyanax mexicanus]